MGRIFSKRAFHGGLFWTNLCGSKLTVVHWCVTGEGRGGEVLKSLYWGGQAMNEEGQFL